MQEKTDSEVRNRSYWRERVPFLEPRPLQHDEAADVCVVGGGIAGITTAYLLARKGVSVVLIEQGPLSRGETSHTTAHLSNAIDDRYFEIERVHGEEGARIAAESHGAAIDKIEEIVLREKIDCGFERLDGYLFLGDGDSPKLLEKELLAAHRAGLSEVEELDFAPVRGFTSGNCLRFPRVGQFHPLEYVNSLIEVMGGLPVKLFSHTHASKIEGGEPCRVMTSSGAEISSKAVVVATNSPVNERFALHSKQFPYRTYVVGLTVPSGGVDPALYWDTHEPYHYVRLQRGYVSQGKELGDGWDLLIVGGEDHKTGHADDSQIRYDQLEQWARHRFPAVDRLVSRWSGQVMETVDGLAFIGRTPQGEDNVYVATGDSGMGMTHGTIAGLLIRDLILGKENPWEKIYDPARKPLGSLSTFAAENLDVALKYTEYLTSGDKSSEESILPGEGAILKQGITKVATYRDQAGKLHSCSAICPHLGCLVTWNSDAASWDCPCHGSRFDPFGHVLNGPSIKDLSKPKPA